MLEHKDAGFSLVEVLIAVAIMGIAMVAVLGALGTQISGVRVHRNQSDANTVVVSAAERVKDPSLAAYAPCSDGSTYATVARAVTPPADWTARGWSAASSMRVPSVLFWNGSAFGATCYDNDSTDTKRVLRLQLVTVEVTSPNGDDVETVQVVKRP